MNDAIELGGHHELLIRTRRRDGSWAAQPVWVVTVDGEPYIRSAFGTRGLWYRRVRKDAEVRVEADGETLPVRLVPADDRDLNRRISDAYRAKYGPVWPGPVGNVVGADACATTLRVVPDPRPARRRSGTFRKPTTPAKHEYRSTASRPGEIDLLIARHVEPGHEPEFERWAHGILSAAAEFPGHLGYGLFRPRQPGEPWYVVHRFRDSEAHQGWHHSPERAHWFARTDGHHTEIDRRRLTGLETWFTAPDSLHGPPPRRKMAITAAIGIFPISLVAGMVLQPALEPVPVIARTALIAAVFGVVMTYAVMPALTRALHRWLTY
jgi:antibiotic biosynthesis monooxygenase (ABM) superfamily enzyme